MAIIMFFLFHALLLFLLTSDINLIASQSIIKTLPGFSGDLPFKLETGYIGVGDLEEVQLFYYFVESERSPKDDPLLLWLTGGPGCSGLSAIFYENGPLKFDYANSSIDTPSFLLNRYSWTKVANVIFVDAPVGTGFSYAQEAEGYNNNDTSQVTRNYEFLRKWLVDHPRFLENPLYITGDSYSGMITPMLVDKIIDANDAGVQPLMNLKGYVLGNPVTDNFWDQNSRIDFAHGMGLISNKLYESTKRNCDGVYVVSNLSNPLCLPDLQIVNECLTRLEMAQILEPSCCYMSPTPRLLCSDDHLNFFLQENSMDLILTPKPHHHTHDRHGPWCRVYNYVFSYAWANDAAVQRALHVRQGTIKEWDRCNLTVTNSYTHNIKSVVGYHLNITEKGFYRALIYSGDHDMAVPYLGTMTWIESLNLTVGDAWRPWFTNGQVSGYTELYTVNKYSLTYATVKGGGHTAPEYKPEEVFAMIERWFAYMPL